MWLVMCVGGDGLLPITAGAAQGPSHQPLRDKARPPLGSAVRALLHPPEQPEHWGPQGRASQAEDS